MSVSRELEFTLLFALRLSKVVKDKCLRRRFMDDLSSELEELGLTKRHQHQLLVSLTNMRNRKNSWKTPGPIYGSITEARSSTSTTQNDDASIVTTMLQNKFECKRSYNAAALSIHRDVAAVLDLPTFREMDSERNRADYGHIISQALILFEQNYVHLPLKRAMYAVDPVQKLRLLEHRIISLPENDLPSEIAFHQNISEIFMSVRDLHTKYLLPAPYNRMTAFLPFNVEYFIDNGKPQYIVSQVMDGFNAQPFEPGVEVLFWNGVGIDRAVQIMGERFSSGNEDARQARGIAKLTVRPLRVALLPDEDTVTVGYRDLTGKLNELRVCWQLFTRKVEGEIDALGAHGQLAMNLGVDIEQDEINRAKKLLLVPQVLQEEKRLAENYVSGQEGGGYLEELVPSSVMEGRVVETKWGKYGYIRLRRFAFNVDADGDGRPDLNEEKIANAIVAKFAQLLGILPQQGLVIDVRGNGGGLIWAGERLLQLMSPEEVQPEQWQFINTPLNLELCRRYPPLTPWVDSILESVRTGAMYSNGFPITSIKSANSIGQLYHGPVVLITDALCYSTTDIFAAGFQDHNIGVILGVDRRTGAGGGNSWTHTSLRRLYAQTDGDSPYKTLPNEAGMGVTMRRSLRVGKLAGTPVEDNGVTPDYIHNMTRDDLLHKNVDLIDRAGEILMGMPRRILLGEIKINRDESLQLRTETKGISRLDIFSNDRPLKSVDIEDGWTEIMLPQYVQGALDLRGYQNGALVARRKLEVR